MKGWVGYSQFGDLYLVSVILPAEVMPGPGTRRLRWRVVRRWRAASVLADPGLLADYRVVERLRGQ